MGKLKRHFLHEILVEIEELRFAFYVYISTSDLVLLFMQNLFFFLSLSSNMKWHNSAFFLILIILCSQEYKAMDAIL